MKVLQINAVCGVGSTGRICQELSDSLIEEGHESLILFGNGQSDYFHAKKIASKIGVKIHGVLSRLTGKNATFSPISTGKAIKEIKRFQPSIVHLHNLHGNYINLKRLLKYLSKNDIATVITLHDCWFFTGKCTHYTSVRCYKWQKGCKKCPKLKADIPSWFFDRTPKMWKEKKQFFSAIPRLAVVGVSDWITVEAQNCFLKDAKIIQRIYNWIDLSVFYPRTEDIRDKYGIPKDKFLVLCIGAGWTKGTAKYEDLLRLSSTLGDDTQIVLAGNIPEGENLPSNITAIGYVRSTEELAKLYSQADVYVHLSREDTFGKVIAEALACGTPAIVYNATACPELIGEGCGYVVKTGNIEEVENCIDKVRELGKLQFSDKCTHFVKENFEKEQLIKATIELYDRLSKE